MSPRVRYLSTTLALLAVAGGHAPGPGGGAPQGAGRAAPGPRRRVGEAIQRSSGRHRRRGEPVLDIHEGGPGRPRGEPPGDTAAVGESERPERDAPGGALAARPRLSRSPDRTTAPDRGGGRSAPGGCCAWS